MTHTLLDMDVEYDISEDTNEYGKDFIRISPLSRCEERDNAYDICLGKSEIDDLIDSLVFFRNRLTKSKQ